MPIKLSRAQAKTGEERNVRIDFGKDGDLNLTILPNAVTIKAMRRLNAAAKENDIATVADVFCGWVNAWDLLDDAGEVLPIDQSTIDLFGVAFFGDLAEKIQAASVPNPETATS